MDYDAQEVTHGWEEIEYEIRGNCCSPIIGKLRMGATGVNKDRGYTKRKKQRAHE